MDKYSVKLMSRALRDLDGIYNYIAHTLLEPGTALNLVGRVEDAILSLETMPYRCPERRRGAYANRGYRQLFVENYTAVFRIDEAKKTVIVVTVRYSCKLFAWPLYLWKSSLLKQAAFLQFLIMSPSLIFPKNIPQCYRF